MPYFKTALKERAFLLLIRSVLYNQKLKFGARCLAFALMDSSPHRKPKLKVLARKLGSDTSTVSDWLKELDENFQNFRNFKVPLDQLKP